MTPVWPLVTVAGMVFVWITVIFVPACRFIRFDLISGNTSGAFAVTVTYIPWFESMAATYWAALRLSLNCVCEADDEISAETVSVTLPGDADGVTTSGFVKLQYKNCDVPMDYICP